MRSDGLLQQSSFASGGMFDVRLFASQGEQELWCLRSNKSLPFPKTLKRNFMEDSLVVATG